MSSQRSGKNGKVATRTITLPASLRSELVSLGKLPALSSGGGSRKDKRAAASASAKSKKRSRGDGGRNGDPTGSIARAAHFANKKIKMDESSASAAAPSASSSSAAPITTVKHTPLERLLAKQQAASTGGAVDPTRKKNKVESTEDQEIAWLEAKLGVRGGPPVATASERGKWKEEYHDDGLDDLFAGIDDLESAAFGKSTKDYSKLQFEDEEGELDSEDDESAEIDSQSDEYGVSDEELFDAGDDDDHREMGELGSEGEEEGGMEAVFDGIDFENDAEEGESSEDDSESDGGDGSSRGDESEDSNLLRKKKAVRFDLEDASLTASTPGTPFATSSASTRYVPPHLRQASASAASPSSISVPLSSSANTPSSAAALLESTPEDPRLRRQLMGHLNKLSSFNIPSILAALATLYASHPRALVSSTLTSLLLEIISGRDNLGEQFVITYAALVAALSREVGVEFAAGVIAKCVGSFDLALEKHVRSRTSDADVSSAMAEVGFEGRPGSKECENIVAFLAELYNFSVVACVLIYDLVRMFIESGLDELEVELLVKVVKRSGQQLRQDDPSSLKQIIGLVKQKMQGIDATTMNSRTRFMIEALTNLKNNKIKPTAEGSIDNYSQLKKFLSGMKKRSGTTPDALRLSLADIRSSLSKGKWWVVGAAWGGDPLVDAQRAREEATSSTISVTSEAKLTTLAKSQGMNTDIRKSVFVVLMSSEDYVDACERLFQLGLTDVQQREIARVLLQCSGNEKSYNPYYTLVAHRMGSKSHSFQITLQYCLWDFIRELGEKSVGGEELVKTIVDDGEPGAKVSSRRVANLAKLYAWCVAKDVLSLTILKPIPFARPKAQTIGFVRLFFAALFISSQVTSPALIISTTSSRKDREAVERIFVKAAPHPLLVKGLSYFLDSSMDDVIEDTAKKDEKMLLKWTVKTALGTLAVGGGIVDVR